MRAQLLLTVSTLLAASSAYSSEAFSPDIKLMSGAHITVRASDVIMELSRAPENVRESIANDQNALRKIIENIYTRRAAAEQAVSLYGNRPDVKADLALQRERLLTEVLLSESTKNTTLTAEAALNYARALYKAEPEKFMNPAEYRVRQIYFPILNPEEACAVRQKAKEILEKVRSGENFISLAAQYAKDVDSSIKGGDLGYLTIDNQSTEVTAALRKFNDVGQVSDLVTTQDSIMILKLEDKRAAKPKSFEDVKEDLVKLAQVQTANQSRSKIIKEIIESGTGDAEGFDNLIKHLKTSGKSLTQ